ncbi:nitroreductase family protein [Bradyrhizobium glycinis]|uniref:nitroreductase family protein n=1 Tax=Bradyrhizobium glycinis TaxID=2751812 RepID=UPI002898799E|nr:nitroreductase family protein [Bradyrhizobium glycinis]
MEAIIESAKRAPSSMNTQPWHVHVLTGLPLEEVRRRNMEELAGGAKVKRDIISMANTRACIAPGRSTSPRSCSAQLESRATTSRCGRTGCCAASASSTRRCRWC